MENIFSRITGKRGKPRPDHLPGRIEERVFVGGQYDFMPTLRAIAGFVTGMSSQEKPLIPIIAADYDIKVVETMERDIRILMQCQYAIFDLSDLGAQLVEIKVAQDQHLDMLIVYPVRERKNEPERGRRTVLSLGVPHFGYMTFNELKGIVWRFLIDAPTEKDYASRVIYDPILDYEIRRVRALLGQGDTDSAHAALKPLTEHPRYNESIEPWLYLALVLSRRSDEEGCARALANAVSLSNGDPSKQAEVWYYKAIIERRRVPPDFTKAKSYLAEAEKLRPDDGRILCLYGYVLWQCGDKEQAVEKTAKALADREIPDPVVAAQAMNNLGYFLAEKFTQDSKYIQALDDALRLTECLEGYHKVFQRRGGNWLETRGFVLTLQAKTLAERGASDLAAATLEEGIDLLRRALDADEHDTLAQAHLRDARALKTALAAKAT